MPDSLHTDRRRFLAWLAASPLFVPALAGCRGTRERALGSATPAPGDVLNVFEMRERAERALGEDAAAYLAGGADDERTLLANETAFRKVGIRARRLVDVRTIDTSLELLGRSLATPILLAPVGFQVFFHPEGELATARAAAARQHAMLVSSASNYSVGEIAGAAPGAELWFQLYPTPNRAITQGLLERAEAAGCSVVALTVDTPVLGNRERHSTTLAKLLEAGELPMGNYTGLRNGEPIIDPSLTWDFIGWLREHTSMRLMLKGIVTSEDTQRAAELGIDGVIVSNHGGRQLESDRAALDCLPEVVAAVAGRLPVLIDGGIRRGTDVFKALALGASAILIGRPFCWGLGAYGQAGVERVLSLLQAELVRAMQLAGTPDLGQIRRSSVT